MKGDLNWPSLALAVATSAAATGAVRAWALRSGRLDAVDASRRLHSVATPRLGGVGMLAGLVAGAVPWLGSDPRGVTGAVFVLLVLAFVTGFIDDVRHGMPSVVKLLLQTLVAFSAVTWFGLSVHSPSVAPWGAIDLGRLESLATALWIVAVTNVVNFMDGSDGIVALTAVVILVAAGISAPAAEGCLLLPMAAATFGFLLWNAPPAKIFMGDCGSHLLGAAIALAPCSITLPSYRALGVGGPPTVVDGAPWPLVGAALIPSILDVAEALIHKARHGIPMSQAHHDHLYQRLVKATGSHAHSAIRYGVLALLAVIVVGPFAERFGVRVAGVVGVAILAAHWIDGLRRTRAVVRLAREGTE